MATNSTKTKRVTISLPAEMLDAADKQAALELRDRSELMREALRHYLTRIPEDDATPEEIEAIKRGRAEIARGDYVTLDQLIHDLGTDRRAKRAKRTRTATK
jgi:metal-responsive CopG/Arc/MetJ family transcriptional regulator